MLTGPCGQLRRRLLAEIHDFVIETGISESQLGHAAVGSNKAVLRFRAGADMRLDTADKITAYMHAERLRRAEPGARRATACQDGACLSESEAEDCEAALDGAPGWFARFLVSFKGLVS